MSCDKNWSQALPVLAAAAGVPAQALDDTRTAAQARAMRGTPDVDPATAQMQAGLLMQRIRAQGIVPPGSQHGGRDVTLPNGAVERVPKKNASVQGYAAVERAIQTRRRTGMMPRSPDGIAVLASDGGGRTTVAEHRPLTAGATMNGIDETNGLSTAARDAILNDVEMIATEDDLGHPSLAELHDLAANPPPGEHWYEIATVDQDDAPSWHDLSPDEQRMITDAGRVGNQAALAKVMAGYIDREVSAPAMITAQNGPRLVVVSDGMPDGDPRGYTVIIGNAEMPPDVVQGFDSSAAAAAWLADESNLAGGLAWGPWRVEAPPAAADAADA